MASDLDRIGTVELLFPSRYLKACDLEGADLDVTITGIEPRHELQMRGGVKESKPVVSLAETPKLWVLNKTNALAVAALHGRELRGWIGRRVTLYPTSVECGRKMVDAVRVRQTVPAPVAADNGFGALVERYGVEAVRAAWATVPGLPKMVRGAGQKLSLEQVDALGAAAEGSK